MDRARGSRERRTRRLLDDDRSSWAFVTRRLLVGVGLVVVGLVWSVLNGTVWATKEGPAPSLVAPHGPVATSVRSLDGMRVRPELLTTNPSADAMDLRVTFHNDAATPRPVAPRDLYLLVGNHIVAPIAAGATPLRPAALASGVYIAGTLRFPYALTPGAVLVYAPPWDGGRSVRWRLYQ